MVKLLIVTNPQISLANVLQTISIFSIISGYKINWEKSEALPLNAHCNISSVTSFSLKWWSPAGIKYVGITLKTQVNQIPELDMSNLIKEITEDLENWKHLPLSLWGKIDNKNKYPSSNHLSL